MKIRVLLWDRFPLIVQGLEQVLRADPEVEVVGRTATLEEARRDLRATHPDVLLHGTSSRGNDCLEGIRTLRDSGDLPGDKPRVILFAESLPERIVVEALRLDVRGMILKEMPPKLMLTCVRRVASGERWMERNSSLAALDMLIAERYGTQHAGFSARETEVLRLLGQGLSNRSIAERMSVSEGTIKSLVQRLFAKLGAENRVGLVMAATARNLI